MTMNASCVQGERGRQTALWFWCRVGTKACAKVILSPKEFISTRAAVAETKGYDRRLANLEKTIAALSADNEALVLEKLELKTLLAQQERSPHTLPMLYTNYPIQPPLSVPLQLTLLLLDHLKYI